MPTTTVTVMAFVTSWKPTTHGDIRVHNPTIRFSHSSQTANAASASIASTAMTTPTMLAFSAALVPLNPKIQGETNRNAPRIRLATSQYLAFVQSFMLSSIEALSHVEQTRNCPISSCAVDENLMKPVRFCIRFLHGRIEAATDLNARSAAKVRCVPSARSLQSQSEGVGHE